MSFWNKKSVINPESVDDTLVNSEGKSISSKIKINPRPLEINLLTYKQASKDGSNAMIYLLVLLLVITGGAMGTYYKWNYDALLVLKTQNNQLSAERNRLQQESGFSASYQNLQVILANKQQNARSLEAQKIYFSHVINGSAAAIPTGVTLTGMKLANGTVGLSGFAGDYYQIASFIAGLRDNPMFRTVTLASCGKGSTSNQIQFTIEIGWEAARQ